MKILKLKIAALLFTVILFGTQVDVFAQQRNGMGRGQGNGYGMGQGMVCSNIPGITDEQKTKMQEFRVVQMKERQQTQNQIREKRAHLITLQTADKVDLNAINKTIDEITALQNAQWKKRAAHKQAIRNLLTDEQRVYFDNHRGRKGQGRTQGNCRGHRHGYGGGNGSGNWNK